MATLTMTQRDGEHLIAEWSREYSNEEITVLSGQDLKGGAVLGQITAAQAAAPIPAIAGTGTGAMTALTFGPSVKTGSYVVTLLATSATAAFSVTGPGGIALPNGAVGTAYRTPDISFLVSSAGTMTIGDSYTVVVTAGGTPVLVGTGTGVVSGLSLGPDAQRGTYRVQLLATSATAELEVTAPDGSKLKRGQVATAYTSNHINFTLSNAGTMTSGDYFNVIVAAGSGKYVAVAPTTFDGRHRAAGVLWAAVDASAGDTKGAATVRGPVVHEAAALGWGTLTSSQIADGRSQLLAIGIVTR